MFFFMLLARRALSAGWLVLLHPLKSALPRSNYKPFNTTSNYN